MRHGKRWTSVIALLVVAGLSGAPASAVGATGAKAAGRCGAAAAKRLVEREHLGNAGFTSRPVAQVLCGPFTGSQSKAMVVSFSTPGCGFSLGWALYRSAHGRWQRVFLTNTGAYLARSGSRIRAWQGVLGPRDAHCFPSRWRTRLWRWDGSHLVAGRWHPSGPPPRPRPV